MTDPTLTISSESVSFIVVKVRELDAQDIVTAANEDVTSVLEAHPDDLVRRELVAFIAALSEEERTDLVALMWLGRGDGTLEDWDDLCDEAQQQHDNRTTTRLLGDPLLSDYLEEGLSQFGFTTAEFEIERL